MMKKLLFMVLCLSAFACSPEPNENCGNILVEETFAKMFPSAIELEWEIEGGYYVADFKVSKQEIEAWFTNEGVWKMTVYDIKESSLPSNVQSAINATSYKNWYFEDAERVERPEKDNLYIVDLDEKWLMDNCNEVKMYISNSGELLYSIENGIDDDNFDLVSGEKY